MLSDVNLANFVVVASNDQQASLPIISLYSSNIERIQGHIILRLDTLTGRSRPNIVVVHGGTCINCGWVEEDEKDIVTSLLRAGHTIQCTLAWDSIYLSYETEYTIFAVNVIGTVNWAAGMCTPKTLGPGGLGEF